MTNIGYTSVLPHFYIWKVTKSTAKRHSCTSQGNSGYFWWFQHIFTDCFRQIVNYDLHNYFINVFWWSSLSAILYNLASLQISVATGADINQVRTNLKFMSKKSDIHYYKSHQNDRKQINYILTFSLQMSQLNLTTVRNEDNTKSKAQKRKWKANKKYAIKFPMIKLNKWTKLNCTCHLSRTTHETA